MIVENLAAVVHKELGLTLGFWIECIRSRDHSAFVGVKKSFASLLQNIDLERKTMPDSSDSDRGEDLGLSDDQVPSEDENSVTCVPATDDEDASVVVLSKDIKRPLQSSSLRSSTTRAQLKESIPPFWESIPGLLKAFPNFEFCAGIFKQP
jgi:hypothetical protein